MNYLQKWSLMASLFTASLGIANPALANFSEAYYGSQENTVSVETVVEHKVVTEEHTEEIVEEYTEEVIIEEVTECTVEATEEYSEETIEVEE